MGLKPFELSARIAHLLLVELLSYCCHFDFTIVEVKKPSFPSYIITSLLSRETYVFSSVVVHFPYQLCSYHSRFARCCSAQRVAGGVGNDAKLPVCLSPTSIATKSAVIQRTNRPQFKSVDFLAALSGRRASGIKYGGPYGRQSQFIFLI